MRGGEQRRAGVHLPVSGEGLVVGVRGFGISVSGFGVRSRM